MLANRLAILLAERGVTIKQVVETTGLSRNTLSNLANHPRGNISIDTTDILCNYFRISPKDFFEYSPLHLSYSLNKDGQLAKIVIRENGRKSDEYAVSFFITADEPSNFRSYYLERHFDYFAQLEIDPGFLSRIIDNVSPRFIEMILEDLSEIMYKQIVDGILKIQTPNIDAQIDLQNQTFSVATNLVIKPWKDAFSTETIKFS